MERKGQGWSEKRRGGEGEKEETVTCSAKGHAASKAIL
jgi:hypothetical protein